MMKIYIFWFIVLCNLTLHIPLSGQQESSNWLLGYGGRVAMGDSSWGISRIQFGNNSAKVTYEPEIYLNFFGASSSISNDEGELLFYSNGIFICDWKNDTLNKNESLSNYKSGDTEYTYGMRNPQNMVSLPIPGRVDEYIIIHSRETGVFNKGTVLSEVYTSSIKVNRSLGLSKVQELNSILSLDTIANNGISVVRHGNGRDWWIILLQDHSNVFKKYLLSPRGLIFNGEEKVKRALVRGLGQGKFTPNGGMYVRHVINGLVGEAIHHVDIIEFDRCTGHFSNQSTFSWTDSSAVCAGLAISSSSQFAYLPSTLHLYQIDLFSNTPLLTLDTVATWDSTYSPPGFATVFYSAQLGNDNKIYISACNSVNTLHVINSPNRPGEDCNVAQNAIGLIALNATTMPYQPNYSLGKCSNCNCDSLRTSTIRTPIDASEIIVGPNPTNGLTKFFASAGIKNFQVYGLSGKKLEDISLYGEPKELSIDLDLPAGSYIIKLDLSSGRSYSEILVIK